MTITLIFNLPFSLAGATSPSLSRKFTNFPVIKPQLVSNFSTLSLVDQRYLSPNPTHVKNTVIYARSKKRRSGDGKFSRLVFKSIYIFANYFDILPEPFASMVKEFGGGNGGRVGFFKGFGGGGREKNNKDLLFLVFAVAFGYLIWLGFGENLEANLILGSIIFGALIGNFWKRGFKLWAQGVCFIAAMGFLGFKRENLQRMVKGIGATISSRRRKRRRVA